MGDEPQFQTMDGISVPAVTTTRMREIDRIAVEETGPGLLQMMEHAGRSLAVLALRTLGRPPADARVVVLAGTGGNGGGGICAARHLASRVGEVLLCVTDSGALRGAPAVQHETFGHSAGHEVDRRSRTPSSDRDASTVRSAWTSRTPR